MRDRAGIGARQAALNWVHIAENQRNKKGATRTPSLVNNYQDEN